MSDAVTVRDVRDAVRSRRALRGRRLPRRARPHRRDQSHLNAFNTVVADRALARAAEIDREPDRWRDAPLAGVPIALKDNLCTRGVRTTASSRMLERYVPPYDATVVERLDARRRGHRRQDQLRRVRDGLVERELRVRAGRAIRGRWIACRAASSGGSAAAVAAGLTPLALGSDTGGSIRQPAALCGVVGLKPTYGRVSRYGLSRFASSLDQIGPLTRTVRDAALRWASSRDRIPADATSAPSRCPITPRP